MTTNTTIQPTSYERTIIGIMRKLPSERILHLLEYARFLEFQTHSATEAVLHEDVELDGNPKWDALLAKPESKNLLRSMAREARAEIASENTTEIGLTKDGRLEPA